MDVGRIQVTPNEMRAEASRVQAEIDKWDQDYREFCSMVQELSECWQGLGNDSFANRFNEEKPKFEQLTQMMTEYRTQIVNAANTYEENERQASQIVSQR